MAVIFRTARRQAGLLIYGGGTGLSYACAEAMATEGASVFIVAGSEKFWKDACARLGDHPGRHFRRATRPRWPTSYASPRKRSRRWARLDTVVINSPAPAGGLRSVTPVDFQTL